MYNTDNEKTYNILNVYTRRSEKKHKIEKSLPRNIFSKNKRTFEQLRK